MKIYNRDDLDEKALGRLLTTEQLSLLFDLVAEAGRRFLIRLRGRAAGSPIDR